MSYGCVTDPIKLIKYLMEILQMKFLKTTLVTVLLATSVSTVNAAIIDVSLFRDLDPGDVQQGFVNIAIEDTKHYSRSLEGRTLELSFSYDTDKLVHYELDDTGTSPYYWAETTLDDLVVRINDYNAVTGNALQHKFGSVEVYDFQNADGSGGAFDPSVGNIQNNLVYPSSNNIYGVSSACVEFDVIYSSGSLVKFEPLLYLTENLANIEFNFEYHESGSYKDHLFYDADYRSPSYGVPMNNPADYYTYTYLTFNGFDRISYTVTAVPEPSTYALMLSGLGLVSFMASRRRKQA